MDRADTFLPEQSGAPAALAREEGQAPPEQDRSMAPIALICIAAASV